FLVDLRVARAWLPLTFITATLVLGGQREAVRQVLAGLRRRGRLLRRVVIVGGNRDAMALCANLKMQRALGYEVVGFVADTDSDELLEGVPRLGSMERAREAIVASHAQGVILVSSALDTEISNQVIRQLSDASVRVDLLPSLVGVAAGRLSVRTLGRFPLVHVRPVRRRGWRQAAKRMFDLALAIGGLVVTAPFLGLIALMVKLDSPGPVLFRQKRVGRTGQLFDMLKFRSMAVDAEERVAHLRELNEADGPLFKMRGDPRITRTGRFLRRFSLDELPQLWNVVKGDMAIVGPRPALPEEITGWSPQLHERLKVKPGITGLWQVNGRSAASFADYTNLDLYYVDNWSLLADLTIVARTIPAVLCRKGAY
ncbi:MAG: sugar transferase, partial [Actinomycetota bacterium]|nr:sugar transferase [Actinomycetota bacterium]